MIKLNETPVRTSRNFNINNITLENVEIPEEVGDFKRVQIIGENSKIKMDEECSEISLNYGLSDFFTNQVKQKANQKIRCNVESKTEKELRIYFDFDEENLQLVDDIEIIANEETKATIMIKYEADEKLACFHNGILRVVAKKGAKVNVIFMNLLNTNSNHFMAIENEIEEKAKVNYCIVDFGGKNSITNLDSNLVGNFSENRIHTIYLGKEKQLLDLNYKGVLRGEKSNLEIEVQGALKDKAKKHFKGTIDFKKGAKKAKGNENEACMLLSDTAKSLALPMLLCSEEEVEGNHSSSAGKIGEKELFYMMSRGFTFKEAQKLMVHAKFNKILQNIKSEGLRNYILKEIDERLE